jgi:DNA gyrase subunit B/topoisomerase-4 subunit B
MKGIKLGAEDIREGIIGVLSIKLPGGSYQAQFQGQTKSKLNNPEVSPIVESVARGLEQLLNEKPSAAQAIINRIILASKARAASREAGQEVRRKLTGGGRLTLPGKLADCSSNRSADTELFIVEGDSAGGSAKQGRDRNTQAVLPLRGKVLNTFAATLKKVLENKEITNIVQALGCGVGEGCKAEKLRYGKIIILTDADADGMHIATLLLSFFFQYMRPIIERGALYIGQPPLYGIFSSSKGTQEKDATVAPKGKKKIGNEPKSGIYWAYSDQELNKIIEKHKLRSPRIVRYKGLGEMNPKTLWDTTLDPDSRTLLRVTVEDEKTVNNMFNDLMGSEPAPRYRLIRDNAELLEVDV